MKTKIRLNSNIDDKGFLGLLLVVIILLTGFLGLQIGRSRVALAATQRDEHDPSQAHDAFGGPEIVPDLCRRSRLPAAPGRQE